MPIAAVAGAVVAIGVAAEVGTTLAVIAAVGATIGAVGAITGIKELAIAGGIIGAVGAIGGLASSAGLFGSAGASLGATAGAGASAAEAGASAAGSALSAGDSIDSEIAQWSTYGGSGGNSVLSGAPVIGTDSGSFNDVVNTVTTGQVPDVTPNALQGVQANAASPDVTPPGVMPDAVTDPFNNPGGVPVDWNTGTIGGPYTSEGGMTATYSPLGQAAPTAPVTPGTNLPAPGTVAPPPPQPSVIPTADSLINGATGAGTITRTAGAGLDASNFWKDITGFIGKPGMSTLLSGAIQAGGAFIGGATSSLTPAQVEAYKAAAQANIAAANLSASQNQALQTQQANMAGALPVARRTPVTGLINQPPVTGAPA